MCHIWVCSVPVRPLLCATPGLFAYSCGCVVVVEDLHTGSQRHWLGHSEEISTLAVTNDAQVLLRAERPHCPPAVGGRLSPALTPVRVLLRQTVASASAGSGGSASLICIWNVRNGACKNTLSHHKGEVQGLAFSRDDLFFLSIGQFGRRPSRRLCGFGVGFRL